MCGELRSAQGTLEQLKRERGNLIEINTSLSNQVILVLILYFWKKEKKKKIVLVCSKCRILKTSSRTVSIQAQLNLTLLSMSNQTRSHQLSVSTWTQACILSMPNF